MSSIKITEEDNLIIQPFMIGNLLLELKSKNFLNSKYFTENFNSSLYEILKSMSLDSQGLVIMLFYAFLVVPYEKLKTKAKLEYDYINKKIDDAVKNRVFILNSNYPDNNYLLHMRNSVAHVRFKFISGTSLTFIDKKEKNKRKYSFELTVPLFKLHLILIDLQNLIINYFNNNRESVKGD